MILVRSLRHGRANPEVRALPDSVLLELAHRLLYRPCRLERGTVPPDPGTWLEALRREGARDEALPDRALLGAQLEGCRRLEIHGCWWGDERYPRILRDLAHPPPVLFYQGSLPGGGSPALALVGSRRPSRGAREFAATLAEAAAAAGIPVISGMARGIDQAAHRGCLSLPEGRTWAVLGCGLDRPYPTNAGALAREISQDGGLLSEFPPGVPPLPFHFPRRNRIIAALSRAVLVVEAGRRSGALSTAREALALGRELAAVPAGPLNPSGEGSNRLLREGASLVLEAEDLLFLLGMAQAPAAADVRPWSAQRCREEGIEDLETLATRSGWLLTQALDALAEWERQGAVERLAGGRWRFCDVADPGSCR